MSASDSLLTLKVVKMAPMANPRISRIDAIFRNLDIFILFSLHPLPKPLRANHASIQRGRDRSRDFFWNSVFHEKLIARSPGQITRSEIFRAFEKTFGFVT